MQITSKFTIAIHILAAIDTFHGNVPVNSSFLAKSIGANPVIVRGVMSNLKKAGIIMSHRGKNDVTIEKPLDQVTFFDIYTAVNAGEKEIFHFHENPNPECPVGRNIHKVLDGQLIQIQKDFEKELRSYKVSDVIQNLHQVLDQEKQA